MKFLATLASLAALASSVAASPITARQYSGSTFNQLTDGTPCRAVTLIYARGTGQQGNVGDPAAVGPLMFNALAAQVGVSNLAVQGVSYAANIPGFLAGGDAAGISTMASLTATVCRNLFPLPTSTTSQDLNHHRRHPDAPTPRSSSRATARALSSSTAPQLGCPPPSPTGSPRCSPSVILSAGAP